MQRLCALLCGAVVVSVLTTSLWAGTVGNPRPRITLDFDVPGASEDGKLEGFAGSPYEAEVTATLNTDFGNQVVTPDGVQAWQISVLVEECELSNPTTSGTAGALISDGGLRDPNVGSFENTEVIDPFASGVFPASGFVSAVILSFEGVDGAPITLPPEGTEAIAKFMVESSFPSPVNGVCEPNICRLAYIDGLQGSGEPIDNKATYRGANVIPTKTDLPLELCAFQADFALGFEVPGSFEGLAGTNVEIGASAVLTANKAEDGFGAQGWQVGYTISGDCELVSYSTAGTAGDLTINGGYRNPGGGFELTENFQIFPQGVGREAIIQAVLLDFDSVLTLPPAGTFDLVNMVVAIDVPSSNADGSCTPNTCVFEYEDGLQGSGDPVDNFVTFRGANLKPTLSPATLNVCPFQGDFGLGFDTPATVEGLAGSSLEYNATATLTSGKDKAGPGAQGWQIGFIATGDCDVVGTSIAGTAADFTTNGGYRAVGNSFELTESGPIFIQGVEQSFVIQAVVLDFNAELTLPPSGTVALVDVTMASVVNSSNSDGTCRPSTCSFEYVNGLQGSGSPINNVVTFQGANVKPSFSEASTDVCPFSGSFALGIDAPAEIEGLAGTTIEYTASATLDSGESEIGAQGWQVGFVVAGDCEIKEVSTDGTAGDFVTNGGYRAVGNSFELTESFLIFPGGVGQTAIIQAVVLDFNGELTLPPSGSVKLVDVLVEAEVNPATPEGTCVPNVCSFTYQDGLQGSGSPITNLVTFRGANVRPEISGGMTTVCRADADFTLGFDAPERVEGAAGDPIFEYTAKATLRTENVDGEFGAQGYQLAIAPDGGWTVVGATLDDTDAGDLLVAGDFFSHIDITDEGVVAAVVLSLQGGVTLPTSGTQSVLKLTLEGTVPASAPGGVCEPTICSLSYPDSLEGDENVLEPVRNLITYLGDNVAPNRTGVSVDVCPFSGDFTLGFAVPELVEGAAGSFAVFDAYATLTAGDLPTENGAQGWDIVVQVGGDLSRLLGATVEGTAADFDFNGGLRPVGSSFEQTEVDLIAGTASSRVVMDFNGVITLPPSGTSNILRLTMEADVPPLTGPECDPNVCSLSYDGENLITYEGAAVLPTLSTGEVPVCAFNPEFALGFDSPAGVVGPAGGTASFDVLATLASQGIEGDDGAQGWQIAIGAGGCSVTSASIVGTDAGGLIVPGNSFESTSLVDGGATSAVVLDLGSAVTLPANSSSSILALSVESAVPDPVGFQCEPALCSLFYLDGLGGVNNRVTFRGGNNFPSKGSAIVEICPDVPAQATFSVTIDGGTSADKEGSRALWTIDNGQPGPQDVGATVVLSSAVEPCASDPAACNGGENTVEGEVFGCADGVDNDGDGLVDSDDPDCRGIQGWSISVATGDCFSIQGATTAGTAGDLALNGGLRDTQSFEKTEVVNPADNDGQAGAVSAVVLSLVLPITLPNLEDSDVLKLSGRIDASGIGPGGMTEPCDVDIVSPSEQGLQGSGLPVKTAVSIAGQTENPAVCSASVKIMIADVVEPNDFIRCDPNDDGVSNIADAIWLVAELFNNGPASNCQKAGDCNDDGSVDVSDATYNITYRFMDGPAPGAPFPDCGADPTADDLSCDSSACP